jgi:hypothetical protein
MKTSILPLLCALAFALPAAAQELPRQLGGIQFLDDLDRALARSKQDGLPVIAYFTFDT